MEYMLLGDGSIKVFNHTDEITEVKFLLSCYSGVAYYWCLPEDTWGCIYPTTGLRGNFFIDLEDVPEVVRLAHMLR